MDVQKVFDALASPIRREILRLARDEELAAGAIASAVGLSPPTVSEHLAVLRGAGLVTVRTAGTYRYHRTCQDVLDGLQSLVRGEGTRRPLADEAADTADEARTELAVVAAVDLPCDRRAAFRCFTDPVLCGRWLGAEVNVDRDGGFRCTTPWGTTVHGRHVDVCAPSLVALRCAFTTADGETVGDGRDTYARFSDTPTGCRIEVHQLVADPRHTALVRHTWTRLLTPHRDR